MNDGAPVEWGAAGGGRRMLGVTDPSSGRSSVGARDAPLREVSRPAPCLAPSRSTIQLKLRGERRFAAADGLTERRRRKSEIPQTCPRLSWYGPEGKPGSLAEMCRIRRRIYGGIAMNALRAYVCD